MRGSDGMTGRPFRFANWHGMVAEPFEWNLQRLDAILKDADIIVDKPDRIVRRIELDGKAFYAKSFLKPRRLADRLKRMVRRPIVLRLWQIHNEMLDSGIVCAAPMLGAMDDGAGTELFISTEIAMQTARIMIKTLAAESLPEIFAKAAKAIARLHRAGFVHGDCIPGNICMDDADGFAFIDNDRTERAPLLFGGNARRRNLVQFCSRSTLRPEVCNEHFTRFLVEYMKELHNITPSVATVSEFIETVGKRIAVIKEQRAAGIK